ncbi:MAG: efflux transporter outer membrane subunit [Verrucomicrobia bacterium]|nr:efflux transporter outer membrane subunit [Verrucomicrobiota bacterium]
MDRKSIVLFLCLLLSTSCMKIPTDEACCKMLDAPCVDTTGFAAGDFPDPCWWQMFNDPQLTMLVERALEDSPTMSRVAAQVRSAEAEASIKYSSLFPTLGINAAAAYQNLGKFNILRAFAPEIYPAHVDNYRLDLEINYEIDFWGKNRNIYQSALGKAMAEMAEQQTAILVLTTSVASAYFKLQAEMQQLALLQEQQKIYANLFNLSQTRQENAVDSSTQVITTNSHLLEINQSVQFSIQRVEIARHMLNMLIGQGPNLCEEVEKIGLNTEISIPLPCNLSSELITRRSDLMAQIWRIEAAAHMVGAAKAEFYPRIDLLALLGLHGVFSDRFFSWGSRFRHVMPAIHIPIFTAGRLRANLRKKRAEFEEMIYSYNESVLKAVQEVADQIVILRTLSENLETEKLLIDNKIQNKNLADIRYRNSIESLTNYLVSENALIEEQLNYISLQYQQKTAIVQLIKALGGGYCATEVPFGCE